VIERRFESVAVRCVKHLVDLKVGLIREDEALRGIHGAWPPVKQHVPRLVGVLRNRQAWSFRQSMPAMLEEFQ